jgi:uncharacterized protein (TIGR02598 family)
VNCSSQISDFRSTASKSRAFSLVEVVLAVGVVSFAFVAILGLIPAGLAQFRQAMDISVCAQIAQRVISDAQQTDFDILTQSADARSSAANFTFVAPTIDGPLLRYFDEAGNEVVPANAATLSTAEKTLIVYYVLTRVSPTTGLPRLNTGGDSAMIATVTVQVAFNPGNKALTPFTTPTAGATTPTGNLFPTVTGVNILTYFAQIARNR